jgi:murein DD-endopeptidase MepM/ murein hydrolase activator NlpD
MWEIPITLLVLALLSKKTIMQSPVKNPFLRSPFGPRIDPVTKVAKSMHNGIDLTSHTGDMTIYAPMDGTVLQAWNDTTYGGGYSMILQHRDGWKTGYAHLASFKAKKGDTVTAGQPIAIMGNTGGHTTGAHLHFTLTNPTAQKVDPALYIGKELPKKVFPI